MIIIIIRERITSCRQRKQHTRKQEWAGSEFAHQYSEADLSLTVTRTSDNDDVVQAVKKNSDCEM